ncbi:nuclear transport factor 2 family protein [Micromonospora sp. NPDC004704]
MFSPSAAVRRKLLPVALLFIVVALGFSQSGSLLKFEPAAARAAVAAAEQPTRQGKAVTAREAATALFEARAAGASPKELAKHFDKEVDWYIQGDTSAVPWLGRKVGRAEVTEHFTQLEELTTPERVEVEAIIGDGDRAIALGTFRVTILATGRSFDSEFAFDITVGRNGLITRYHVLEDSFALSNAYTPQAR